MKHSGVNLSCQQIVSCSDGMYVSSEVEVKLFHWYDL